MSRKSLVIAIITSVIAVVFLVLGVVRGLDLLEARNTITGLKTDIADTKNTINDKENKLEAAAATLETTTEQLDQAQAELADRKGELDAVQLDLTAVSMRLTETTEKLEEAAATVQGLEQTYKDLQVVYDDVQVKYDNTLAAYEQASEPYEYVMKDPSYQEMMDFLSEDKTSEKPYILEGEKFTAESYVCGDYSAETKINASKQGFRCAFVYLSLGSGLPGHACIAFNATDRGLVFIEPQLDAESNPETGEHYWASVINPATGRAGYYPNPEGYSDIVEKYIVIW